MKKNKSPRSRPATMADVERAKRDAMREATDYALVIVFSVLRDKEGYSVDDLRRMYGHVQDLSQSIIDGYVKVQDLKHTLKEEANIEFVQ